mmetsp:Transcript_42165/g.80655  ORF Transcript_42165/g.80655 Transcript_42165/m.80655 type:complete len:81 (+) Transcript_42165:6400-6642(+)
MVVCIQAGDILLKFKVVQELQLQASLPQGQVIASVSAQAKGHENVSGNNADFGGAEKPGGASGVLVGVAVDEAEGRCVGA